MLKHKTRQQTKPSYPVLFADVEGDVGSVPVSALVALTLPVGDDALPVPLGRHIQAIHVQAVHVVGEDEAKFTLEVVEGHREAEGLKFSPVLVHHEP